MDSSSEKPLVAAKPFISIKLTAEPKLVESYNSETAITRTSSERALQAATSPFQASTVAQKLGSEDEAYKVSNRVQFLHFGQPIALTGSEKVEESKDFINELEIDDNTLSYRLNERKASDNFLLIKKGNFDPTSLGIQNTSSIALESSLSHSSEIRSLTSRLKSNLYRKFDRKLATLQQTNQKALMKSVDRLQEVEEEKNNGVLQIREEHSEDGFVFVEKDEDLDGMPDLMASQRAKINSSTFFQIRTESRPTLSALTKTRLVQRSLEKFMKDKHLFSEKERIELEFIVCEGIPANLRPQFWNLCTGIGGFKRQYCDGYYQTLFFADTQTFEEYPNPHFKGIQKDLDRTFPTEDTFTPEVKQSIKRILRAYVWRNPTVGYIQGMNFLVFRLRAVLSEEDTFWTFAMIIETYMPPDYYVSMYGAITQAEILSRIFKQYNMLPDVQKVFEVQQIELITFSVNWFISIFTASLPEATSLRVLDLFFLKGLHSNKVVFDVSIALLTLLRKQIKDCVDQADFYTKIFTSSNELLQQGNELLNLACRVNHDFKQSQVDFYRPVCRQQMLDRMTLELLSKVKHAQDRAKKKPEATAKTFLENFHLFRGRMVEQLRLAQTEPLDFFKCNSKWPICAFFYLGRHVIPEQFYFKCEQSLDSLVIPNYFDKEFLSQPVKTIFRASASTTAANLLLERGFHYCKINLFVNTLASLFVNEKKRLALLTCKHMQVMRKLTSLQAHQKMLKFCKFVREQNLDVSERLKMFPVTIEILTPTTRQPQKKLQFHNQNLALTSFAAPRHKGIGFTEGVENLTLFEQLEQVDQTEIGEGSEDSEESCDLLQADCLIFGKRRKSLPLAAIHYFDVFVAQSPLQTDRLSTTFKRQLPTVKLKKRIFQSQKDRLILCQFLKTFRRSYDPLQPKLAQIEALVNSEFALQNGFFIK